MLHPWVHRSGVVCGFNAVRQYLAMPLNWCTHWCTRVCRPSKQCHTRLTLKLDAQAATPSGRDTSPRPANKPAIEISSSNSAQCRPPYEISTIVLCSGVAFSKRGNQTKGTPNVRPSLRSTHRLLSSKRMASAKMVIPSPFDLLRIVLNNSRNLAQCTRIKSLRTCH
jgi:hypothetical protein